MFKLNLRLLDLLVPTIRFIIPKNFFSVPPNSSRDLPILGYFF